MTAHSSVGAGSLVLDAQALYTELLRGVRALRGPQTHLAGIASGGSWLAERLQQDLGLDGAPHENTARAQKFARQLRGRFGLQVFEVDERYSTTEAHSAGAADADAASAAIILEQFLRNLP